MSKFTQAEMKEFQLEFSKFDQNGDGTIDPDELLMILKNLGQKPSKDLVYDLIKEVDRNGNGVIEFDEFLMVMDGIKSGKTGGMSGFADVVVKAQTMIEIKGHSGIHSFAQEEMDAFAEHISYVLKNDKDLGYLLPIIPGGIDLTKKIGDGVLLAKFINCCVENTIDERALNKRKGNKDLSLFQVNENLNMVVSAAKSIGCQTINLGATELRQGQDYPHIVLGIVWQLVKLQLLNAINLKSNPLLIRLLEEGETLEDLMKLPPDQLLLRWMNYHLKNSDYGKTVTNFSSDVKDGKAYTYLLNQINSNVCGLEGLQAPNNKARAATVLNNADKLGVPTFIKPRDIANGNAKLNLAFVASIFNTCPGLAELTKEEELELAGLMDDDFGDSREERAFRMWINTLGIPGVYINGLFDDCRDGLALLRVLDFIEPGCVPWNKVEKKPKNKFQCMTNCNIFIDTCKKLKFSVVGIGGVDINSGNRKLTLAVVWQMMRLHTIKFLNELSIGGKTVSEPQILEWANKTVAGAGRNSVMKSFKDPSLTTSHFFFDLLFAVEKRIINWDLVYDGLDDEQKLLNARYAISVARKLNCTIFLLPEDIVEVKPKMILTFTAAIMAASLEMARKK